MCALPLAISQKKSYLRCAKKFPPQTTRPSSLSPGESESNHRTGYRSANCGRAAHNRKSRHSPQQAESAAFGKKGKRRANGRCSRSCSRAHAPTDATGYLLPEPWKAVESATPTRVAERRRSGKTALALWRRRPGQSRHGTWRNQRERP